MEQHYEQAIHFTKNGAFAEAIKILTPLAQQGDSQSQYLLASIYYEGGDLSVEETFKWLKMAADQKHPGAIYLLACSVSEFTRILGLNVESREVLLERAANFGSKEAANSLGGMYFTGEGIDQNLTLSAKWHSIAAHLGDLESQFQIGFMYLLGEGVQKSNLIAEFWLTKAAESGNSEASRLLAELYSSGLHGFQLSAEKAKVWTLENTLG